MARPPRSGTMRIYKAYFFRGADPAIAEVKSFVGGRTMKSIEKDGGPASSTMSNWFKGKTKRPQNATLEAAGRALGMKRVWVSNNGNGKKK
jgi:hypothetical protein